jgi:thiamine pyrophosphate-dependent acetolactate synthase large subunit-like protein
VPETRLIPEYLTRAADLALTGQPGPVFVEIAVDLLLGTVDAGQAPIPAAAATRGRPGPPPDEIERVAALLAAAERPAVVAGSGVYWDGAWTALAALAEHAGLPVFSNGMGRGCLPAAHPLAYQLARGLALREADVVLVLGTPLDFRLGYGQAPAFGDQACVVMVDPTLPSPAEPAAGAARRRRPAWALRAAVPAAAPPRRAWRRRLCREPSAPSRPSWPPPTRCRSATIGWPPSWPPSWTRARR